MKCFILLKSSLLFNTLYCIFCLRTNSLQLNNLETKKAMNAKLSGFAIYVKVTIYLFLYNLLDYTFKSASHLLFTPKQK